MQKALTEMNIALHHAVTDITGVSGMAIIGAMLGGERDLNKPAVMKDRRVKKSVAQIALALEGDWRKEHLFALGQAFELYQIYQNKIAECDQQIEAAMRALERKTEPALQHKARKTPKAQATFELKTHLESICGVDLTAVPGLALRRPGPDQRNWTRYDPLEERQRVLQLVAALPRQPYQR